MKQTVYIIAFLTILVPSSGVAFDSFDGASPMQVFESGARIEGEHKAGDEIGRVHAGDDEISSEDVRAAVETLFEERFPEVSDRLAVRVVRLGNSVESASGLRVRLNHSDSVPRGHTQVRLVALNENAWSEAGWALLYVAHFDSVGMALSDVSQGGAVTEEDVTFAWVETTKFRGEPLRPDDFRALRSDELFAHRPLRSGETIRMSDLRPAYLADTGQSITMTYSRNGIELKLTCQAREPGFLGDVIRAYSSDTKSTYKVVLTGPGSAIWKSTL